LATIWPIVPVPSDDHGCGPASGIRIDMGKREYSEPAPVPLCPSQTPHQLTWVRIRATSVDSRSFNARTVIAYEPNKDIN
jgi:hypothetical protein